MAVSNEESRTVGEAKDSRDAPARLVQVPSDTVTLEGTLAVPGHAQGIVLFAHGSGSSHHSPRNATVAHALREAGLGTLLLDLLAPEEDRREEARLDVRLLSNRLISVTHWLAAQPEARHARLGYFGAGRGAAAALEAAAVLGSTIGAVVSRGGRADLAVHLDLVRAPTLLIVGERDPEGVVLNEIAFEALTCEKALTVVPAAAHLFEEQGAIEEVARRATRWFVEHLARHTKAAN
jgi:putative phosphoribosyl transferase